MTGKLDDRRGSARLVVRGSAQLRLQAVAVPGRDVVTDRSRRAFHGVHAATRNRQPFTGVTGRSQHCVELAQAITHGAVVLEAKAVLDARRPEPIRWLGKARG